MGSADSCTAGGQKKRNPRENGSIYGFQGMERQGEKKEWTLPLTSPQWRWCKSRNLQQDQRVPWLEETLSLSPAIT